ncbi:MAG: hypothetical protein RIS35_1262 [Pseudomonadota bacterium]
MDTLNAVPASGPNAGRNLGAWGVLAMTLALFGGLLVADLFAQRDALLASEGRKLERRVGLLERSLSQNLQTTANALESIGRDIDRIRALPAVDRVNPHLSALAASMLGVRSFLVLDRQGVVRHSNRAALVGLDYHGSLIYRSISAAADPGLLFVSPPFRTPMGVHTIALGRALLDAQGRFDGYLLAIADPAFVSELFESAVDAPDMRAALHHGNGDVIVRHPPGETSRPGGPGILPTEQVVADVAGLRPGAILEVGAARDPTARLANMQAVRPKRTRASAPLVLVLARDADAVLAPWRVTARERAAAFAGIAVAACLGMFLYDRRRRQDLDRLHAEEVARSSAERQLRDSEAYLRVAIEGAGVGIGRWILAEAGLDWSERTYALFGLPAGSGISFEGFLERLHPDDRARVRQGIEGAVENCASREEAFRVLWPDGTEHWLALSIQVLAKPDGSAERVVGAVREITAAKQLEQQLRQALELLSLAESAAGAAAWLWDMSSGKLSWTDRVFVMLGLDPATTAASFDAWRGAVHPDDLPETERLLQRAADTGEKFSTSYRIVLPSGELRWVDAIGQPIADASGVTARFAGLLIDATDRKAAEQRLLNFNAELEAEVRRRTAQLEAANAAKSAFVANMSHEIRTPLNAILGLTELVLEGDLESGQRGRLERVKVSGGVLLGVLNDILDHSKIEAGMMSVEAVPVRVEELLARRWDLFVVVY